MEYAFVFPNGDTFSFQSYVPITKLEESLYYNYSFAYFYTENKNKNICDFNTELTSR